jgi:ZIP family zinc transporter
VPTASIGSAVVFGTIASSALLIGAAVGVRWRLPERALAVLLSFAAGALITALAFELFEESRERGGLGRAVLGLAAGAVVFTVLSALLDRAAQGRSADTSGSVKLDTGAAAADAPASPASTSGAAGLALLAAVVLDGVPENVALGVSLTTEVGGFALLAAVFVSNLPESLVGAASMTEQGRSSGWVLGVWALAAAALTGAVVLGAGPLAATDDEIISLPLAFAAGAVLASLADTLMPEAYDQGGPAVALSTAAGFSLSYALSLL